MKLLLEEALPVGLIRTHPSDYLPAARRTLPSVCNTQICLRTNASLVTAHITRPIEDGRNIAVNSNRKRFELHCKRLWLSVGNLGFNSLPDVRLARRPGIRRWP